MTLRYFWSNQPLVRLFAVHTAIGFAISTVAVGAALASDFGGLATLMSTAHAWGAAALLWFFLGLTCASAQMGIAIMSLTDAPPPGGGKRERVGPGALARIKA